MFRFFAEGLELGANTIFKSVGSLKFMSMILHLNLSWFGNTLDNSEKNTFNTIISSKLLFT